MQLYVQNRSLLHPSFCSWPFPHARPKLPRSQRRRRRNTSQLSRRPFSTRPGRHQRDNADQGQVTSELLDVDDAVRSRAITTCDLNTGQTICQLEMPPATPYSRTAGTEGTCPRSSAFATPSKVSATYLSPEFSRSTMSPRTSRSACRSAKHLHTAQPTRLAYALASPDALTPGPCAARCDLQCQF